MSKVCFKCNTPKDITEFYRHPQMGDGRLGKCKECAKSDVTLNREVNIDHYRRFDRTRGNRQTPEYLRNYKQRFPEKCSAMIAVSNAVRDGSLERSPCEFCGATLNVHAHHEDYSRPLDVWWLCVVHHHARHKVLRQIKQ